MEGMEIFRLFGKVLLEDEQAKKGLEDIDKKAEGVGSKLGSMIGTAAKWGAGILAGASTAVGGMLALANKTSAAADQIDKMSIRTGLSNQQLQELKFVTGQVGVNFESIQGAVSRMTMAVGQASDGSDQAAATFQKLGISITDASGNLRSTDALFNEAVLSLASMENETQRNALAMELFGKGATELIPLFDAGAEGIQQLSQQAHDLGAVMSDEAIGANVKFADTMDAIKTALGGVMANIGTSALPLIQSFADLILQNMPAIQGVLSGLFTNITQAVAGFLPFLIQLVQELLPPLVDILGFAIQSILPPLIELFTTVLTTILPPLIEIIGVLIETVLPPLIELFEIVIQQILPPVIELFQTLIESVLPPIIDLLNVVIDTVLPPLIELFEMIIDTILPPIIDLMTMWFTDVLPVLIEILTVIIETILPPLIELFTEVFAEVLPPLIDIFMEIAEVVLPLVMEVFKALMPVIGPIMKAIAAVIKTVLALIKGDWEGVWNGIKSFFGAIWDAITGAFNAVAGVIKGIWDGIINGFKAAINWIIGGVNGFIRFINSLRIKIPEIDIPLIGKVGGWEIGLPRIPEIPLLAEGGEIEEPGRVIVGEEAPEILDLPRGARVTPLDKVGGGVTVNINNPTLFNDSDADRLGDLIVNRLRVLGVNA